MKRLSSFLIAALLLLQGCTHENFGTEAETQSTRTESETIALYDALANLEKAMNCVQAVKSNSSRIYSTDDIIVVGKHTFTHTKSFENEIIPDTLMYVVNFENENGFAVMSANKRLGEDVYCITEAGSLSADDFTEAFSKIFNEHEDNIEGKYSEAGPIIVPSIVLSSMISDLIYGKQEKSPATKASRGNVYGPYIQTKRSQQKNDRGELVWNKYTPNHYPAGCVAIATSQIMLYNRLPANPFFDGKQCNWDDMNKVCNGKDYGTSAFYGTLDQQDQVAHFVYEIGKRHNCYIRYDEDGSGGWADGAKRTLKNYGYSDVKKFLGFGKTNQKKADAQLKRGLPVYLDGSRGTSGHAWIIDGLMDDAYYHINWGWLGASDGYYKKGVFSTTDRHSVENGIDTGTSISESRNYTWNYRLITYSK